MQSPADAVAIEHRAAITAARSLLVAVELGDIAPVWDVMTESTRWAVLSGSGIFRRHCGQPWAALDELTQARIERALAAFVTVLVSLGLDVTISRRRAA